MRLWRTQLLVSVLLATICYASELRSQTTASGGLTGVVTDQSDAVVPDTDVEIADNTKGTTHSTKTDRAGVYRFFFLAPARYTLTVNHPGFREVTKVVTVLLGPPVTVNVTLKVAKERTAVEVKSEAPLMQAENGDVSTTMSQRQIAEVPNPGNDLTYIAQSAPAAIMQTDFQGGAAFSILGMSGMSYLYTVDGMNDNENGANFNQSGALLLLLGQNQIQEATVLSTGYSGQFGGAAGGNINYITKSGGREFHGNAQYYWNGRVFNANDWILKALGKPRPFDIADQWAESFGGPLKKEKLFFFFDSEGLRVLIAPVNVVTIPSPQFQTATLANIENNFGVGSASDLFYRKMFNLYNAAQGASSVRAGTPTDPLGCGPFTKLGPMVPCSYYFVMETGRPSDEVLMEGRFDSNISKKDRAFLRLQYDHSNLALNTDPINPVFDASIREPWWQGQVIETHTFGSSAASQLLLAGSYFALIGQVDHPAQALAAFPTTIAFGNFGGFTPLGGTSGLTYPGGRYNTQYQVSEDVLKTTGKHKIGLGGQFARIYWSELPNKSGSIGTLLPQTLDAF